MRILLLVGMAAIALAQQPPRAASKLAPYVASPTRAIDRMLEMANIRPGETVFDLGCGDGRVLVAAVEKYKARAVGVEISSKLVAAAKARVEREGLSDQIRVIEGDLFQTDLSSADVVMVYLDSASNKKLAPKLERSLHAGARVVSKDFAMPGWKPVKTDVDNGHGSVYFYEMPITRQ